MRIGEEQQRLTTAYGHVKVCGVVGNILSQAMIDGPKVITCKRAEIAIALCALGQATPHAKENHF